MKLHISNTHHRNQRICLKDKHNIVLPFQETKPVSISVQVEVEGQGWFFVVVEIMIGSLFHIYKALYTYNCLQIYSNIS